MMTTIREVDPAQFHIPMAGHPLIHRTLEWYGTDDAKLLGVVILDLVDKDFSWVILGDDGEQAGYTCLLSDASISTQEEARKVLHKQMRNYHKNMEV
jgi:hypothetical protein